MTRPVRSCPRTTRHALAGDDDEAGLVAGVVGDVVGDDRKSVALGGDPRSDGGETGLHGVVAITLGDELGGTGRRLCRADLDAAQPLAEEAVALRRGDRERHDRFDFVQSQPSRADEAVLDVEDDLAGDQQVVVERQGVLGEVDDALDGVLDRHDPAVDVAGLDRVEHVRHRDEVDEFGGGEVGLGAHGLLGERAEGPEETDP